jgi:hypothetical protein
MDRDKEAQQKRMPNETAEREASTLRTEATPPQPQFESNKTHGDKLDPIIPRDADQKGDR